MYYLAIMLSWYSLNQLGRSSIRKKKSPCFSNEMNLAFIAYVRPFYISSEVHPAYAPPW